MVYFYVIALLHVVVAVTVYVQRSLHWPGTESISCIEGVLKILLLSCIVSLYYDQTTCCELYQNVIPPWPCTLISHTSLCSVTDGYSVVMCMPRSVIEVGKITHALNRQYALHHLHGEVQVV